MEELRGQDDSGASQESVPARASGWRQRRAFRIGSALVGIVAVGISTYYVVQKLGVGFRELASSRISPDPYFLALALSVTFLSVYSGGSVWYLMLRGMGGAVRWRTCVRTQLLSNLGGYVPGYGWKHVGKAYLVHREGVNLRLASAAALLEFAYLGATRVVVLLSTVPEAFMIRFGLSAWLPYLGVLRAVVWAAMVVSPWALTYIAVRRSQRARSRWAEAELKPQAILGAALLMCANWLLTGLGYVVVMRSIHPVGFDQVLPVISSTTTSFIVSLILFFIPAGLSVREGVIIYMLEGVFPAAIVGVGTIVSRVVLLLAELMGVGVGLLLWRRDKLCK